MRGIRGKSGWIVALTVLAVTAGSTPAQATFSGRNGYLGWTWSSGGKYDFPSSGIAAIDRRIRVRSHGLSTRLFDCHGWVLPLCYVRGGAAFAPDGRSLAFEVRLFEGSGAPLGSQLVVASSDRKSISRVPVGSFVGTPAWSPDGTRLLVAGTVGPEPNDGSSVPADLFLIGLDGQVVERLTHDGKASQPDWASDGTIAFVRGGQIQLMRLGEGWRQLTWRGGSSPSWAPDGSRLAFVRGGQVWSVRADGRSPRRLTRRGGISPSWSPDGRRIAFIRPGDEVDSLWTMRADGKAPRYTGESWGPSGYGSIGYPMWQALRPR